MPLTMFMHPSPNVSLLVVLATFHSAAVTMLIIPEESHSIELMCLLHDLEPTPNAVELMCLLHVHDLEPTPNAVELMCLLHVHDLEPTPNAVELMCLLHVHELEPTPNAVELMCLLHVHDLEPTPNAFSNMYRSEKLFHSVHPHLRFIGIHCQSV